MINSTSRAVRCGGRCRSGHVAVIATTPSWLMEVASTAAHHHHHQQQQVRSYIPPAYRSKNRLILVRPSKRVGGGGGGGRAGRMKRLFEDHKQHAPEEVSPEQQQHGGEYGLLYGTEQQRRITEGEVVYLQRQKHELLKISRRYRAVLRNNIKGIDDDDEVTSLTDLLKTLHKDKEGIMIPASFDTLVQSEELFRKLCLFLRDMVMQWARQANGMNDGFSISRLRYLFGEDPQRVAEELFLALAEVRTDRAALVQTAMLPAIVETPPTDDVMKNIGTWVGKIFGLDKEKKKPEPPLLERNKKRPMELLAHVDPKYGPDQEHLATVLQNIATDTQGAFQMDPSKGADALAHAKRTTLLLEQCTAKTTSNNNNNNKNSSSSSTVSIDAGVVNVVLQAWTQVGTLEAAQEAERIYFKYDGNKDWNSNLLLVLKAGRNAALAESTSEARLAAVMRAKELLQQKVRTSPRLLSPPIQRLRAESFIALLQAYQNAGTQVIPDMGKHAQDLMKIYMDEKSFSQLEGSDKVLLLGGKRPRPTTPIPELDLLDALVLTYAMTGSRDFVLKAVRLLNVILDSRKNTEWSRLVPTAPTVDGLVQALLGLKRVWRDTDDKQSAIYATELLDILYWMDHQLPLPSTFQHIFQLLERSKAHDAPDQAEQLLSRLEIRSALHSNRSQFIDRSIYHMVLNCWREAARMRPGAATKALRLLEKMEAQGSPYPPSLTLSPPIQDIVSRTYNEQVKPNEDTYLLVLQTCFNSQLATDKEVALNIALDVYSKMSERGIRPSDNVVNTMLSGCKFLAPDDAEKRAALARTIYDIARDSGLARNKQVLRSILSTAAPGVTSSNKH